MITYWNCLLLGGVLFTITVCEQSTTFEGPIISDMNSNTESLPKEIILKNGSNFTFICKGDSPLTFKQQYLTEDRALSQFNMSQTQLELNDSNYKYSVALELFDIDEFAVGYYACFDDTIDPDDVLNDVVEEPVNTRNISYIYVYVNGSNRLIAPMSEVVKAKGSGNKFVIACRPTMPDVSLHLEYSDIPASDYFQKEIYYNPKVGFVLNSADIYDSINYMTCVSNGSWNDDKTIFVYKQKQLEPPRPKILVDNWIFTDGETFSLNCTAIKTNDTSSVYDFEWIWPNKNRGLSDVIQNYSDDRTSKSLIISNATPQDDGTYVCKSSYSGQSSKTSISMSYRKPGFIELRPLSSSERIRINISSINKINFVATVWVAYPMPKFNYLFNGKKITIDKHKYVESFVNSNGRMTLKLIVNNLKIEDSGNYTIQAINKLNNASITIQYDFVDPEHPVITFDESRSEYLVGQVVSFKCSIKRNPMAVLQWYLNDQLIDKSAYETSENKTHYLVTSILKLTVSLSGNVSCALGGTKYRKSKNFYAYELENGFGIPGNSTRFWIPENKNVNLKCLASVNKYSNSTWLDSAGNNIDKMVKYYERPLSHVAELKIDQITQKQAGTYKCVGYLLNSALTTEVNTTIEVAELEPTIIMKPEVDENVEVVEEKRNVTLKCHGGGIPPPRVEWKKDDVKLNSSFLVETITYDDSNVNSTLTIPVINDNAIGQYKCFFYGDNTMPLSRSFTVSYKNTSPLTKSYIAVIAVIIILLFAIIVYLTWKIQKARKFKSEMRKLGLYDFKHGKTLNPDLGLDQQAGLLPYDDKFEFPREKLFIDEPLGAGAFGEVYKARAQGIINAERTDVVAVKMVKKNTDISCIGALASELKIMIHIGKHINIVNLLGAVTKNIAKSELIVIVEYCEFGNLHNYVRRHREVFIDQLTGNMEKSGRVNNGYSCSSYNSNGMQSDYFGGTNQTQATENTFLNSANSNQTSGLVENKMTDVKLKEEGSERSFVTKCRSESNEYSDGRKPRPLTSRDLLAWSFQIARGMEYLASKKVLHGDLAARNLLLAKDNVVKICDFGLARSMYKNDEYQKQEHSLLPVKWLAIECMTDMIFSTQSDVWAFGIVLWELFSLAKTPYPNIGHTNLLEWLQQGNRLEKPAYADDRIYDVMMKCWHHKPNARPNFSDLQERLGSFLEDNVRNHYVDLNAECANANLKREGEDYLAMVAAPDYNNVMTPSPNHYVNVDNKQFFPPSPPPQDDEGYLQVTPRSAAFIPRELNKFNFESNHQSTELTPMLSTNNLPTRSTSDSDQESSIFPYPKLCPPIEEETVDDVFVTNNENNIKNTVTNPTYITFAADIEKNDFEKKKFPNNYVNIPSLVK